MLFHVASALAVGVGVVLALVMDEIAPVSTWSSRFEGWSLFDQNQLIAAGISLLAVNVCLHLAYRLLVDLDGGKRNDSPGERAAALGEAIESDQSTSPAVDLAEDKPAAIIEAEKRHAEALAERIDP